MSVPIVYTPDGEEVAAKFNYTPSDPFKSIVKKRFMKVLHDAGIEENADMLAEQLWKASKKKDTERLTFSISI
jgi:hypothetical protein